MGQDLPALVADGMPSFKVYMTYDSLKLDDRQMLEVLSTARRCGAMVMIHAENHDMIKWLTDRLLSGGYVAPKFHAISHADIAEGEATHRAIRLSQLMDVPILLVHVSAEDAMEEIRRAQTSGLKIYGEIHQVVIILKKQFLLIAVKNITRVAQKNLSQSVKQSLLLILQRKHREINQKLKLPALLGMQI